uniref:Methyltransferase n=1 Tax=Pithovirus LCPAC102 TaxID=2506587 RepID=A0A481Z2U4_9VIRU|nr:MAG: hypothetical protein LCPAC102_00120 [Pithovirus LCPAC102]
MDNIVYNSSDCPKCHQFMYEDNHINCIISYTRETFKMDITNMEIFNKLTYEYIYEKILPPIHKGWPGSYLKLKNKNINVIQQNIPIYDMAWRSLWIEEFLSHTLIPSWDILQYMKHIIKKDSVLNIGTGNGLYSLLLQKIGCNIYSTDSYENIEKQFFYRKENNKSEYITYTNDIFTYIDIEKIDNHVAFELYGSKYNILLIIERNDYLTIEDLNNFKGNKIIIIGTINNKEILKYFKISKSHIYYNTYKEEPLHQNEYDNIYNTQNWILRDSIIIPSWFGLEDSITFMERII